MIKIEKDKTLVPDSLQIPNNEFFPNGIPQPSETTHQRRLELITLGRYRDEPIYNSRYKQTDTHTLLKNIYHNKCAFCEQIVEQGHIEHYRPKKKYFWLAYSWDNLLFTCPTCNINKDIHFEILGSPGIFLNTPENVKALNQSGAKYDEIEQPKMVNPEATDPNGNFQFQRDGKILSEDIRFAYTIEKCKIDRDGLNDQRRKLLNIFERDIKSAIIENDSVESQATQISGILRKFMRDSEDSDLQFLAFRKFVISKSWLNEIVKELRPSGI